MRYMFEHRSLLVVMLVPLIVGLAGFFRLASQPNFANIRAVDVVQLTGSGVCFGVALMAAVLYLRLPKD